MTTWKHTKKILMDHLSTEGCTQHENEIFYDVYEDWHWDQIDSGLADPNLNFQDICKKISDTMYAILVTDQAQADSYIAMAYAIGDQIGYPLKATVVDHTE
jgi:hypothetical protein